MLFYSSKKKIDELIGGGRSGMEGLFFSGVITGGVSHSLLQLLTQTAPEVVLQWLRSGKAAQDGGSIVVVTAVAAPKWALNSH